MKVSVNHMWGDTTLFNDSTYLTANGDSIRILNTGFILSGISFIDGNDAVTVDDRLGVVYENGLLDTIASNIILVESDGRFNYDVGSFSKAKGYDGLTFSLGLGKRFESDDLSLNDEYFDEATLTYTNFKMEYIYNNDTLSYEIIGPDKEKEYAFMGFLDLPVGIDFTIPLNLNYELLFRNVNVSELQTGTEDEVFFTNLDSIFFL